MVFTFCDNPECEVSALATLPGHRSLCAQTLNFYLLPSSPPVSVPCSVFLNPCPPSLPFPICPPPLSWAIHIIGQVQFAGCMSGWVPAVLLLCPAFTSPGTPSRVPSLLSQGGPCRLSWAVSALCLHQRSWLLGCPPQVGLVMVGLKLRHGKLRCVASFPSP